MAAEVYFTGENPVFGNKRMAIGTITLSGLTSGAADVGLGRIIDGGSVSLRAYTDTTSHTVAYNLGSGSTTIYGQVRIGSAVAGEVFDVIIVGE